LSEAFSKAFAKLAKKRFFPGTQTLDLTVLLNNAEDNPPGRPDSKSSLDYVECLACVL